MLDKLLSVRKKSAAVLAGVALLGATGASVLGAGVAEAGPVPPPAHPTVILNTVGGSNNVFGTQSGEAGGTWHIQIDNAQVGGKLFLTITCPTSPAFIAFLSGPTAATPANPGLTPPASAPSTTGTCGGGVNDQLTIGGPTGFTAANLKLPATATSPVSGQADFLLTPTYRTSAVQQGPIVVTGAYVNASSPVAIPAPVQSDATSYWFNASASASNTVANVGNNQVVNNVSLNEPAGINQISGTPTIDPTTNNVPAPVGAVFTGNGTLCLSIVSPTAGATFGQLPTLSNATGAGATLGAPVFVGGNTTIQWPATDTTAQANYLIQGLTVNIAAPASATNKVKAEFFAVTGIGGCSAASPPASPPNIPLAVFTLTSTNTVSRIFGQTVDDTVAQELEAEFPSVSNIGTPGVAALGVSTVVLATDLLPNDALAAAYLEAQLGTGLLVVPQNQWIGSAAAAAARLEGISQIYVVGGPLAVSDKVIADIQSTPVFSAGGIHPTGVNLQVAARIFGQTADDTAKAIDTFQPFAPSAPINLTAAYAGTNSLGGIGLYNDTAGLATTVAPATQGNTAVVVSDTNWQDSVTIGPIAYQQHLPIIPTPLGSLGQQAKDVLNTLPISQVIVVGGPLAVSDAVVSAIQALPAAAGGTISVLRVAGLDARDTAAMAAHLALSSAPAGLGWNTTGVNPSLVAAGLATQAPASSFLVANLNTDGTDLLAWGDALGAAALGGGATNGQTVFAPGNSGTFQPLLGVQNLSTVGTPTTTILHQASSTNGVDGDKVITNLVIVGGPLAIQDATVTTLQANLAGH